MSELNVMLPKELEAGEDSQGAKVLVEGKDMCLGGTVNNTASLKSVAGSMMVMLSLKHACT